MTKHSSYIREMTVTSTMPYIVYSSVRGLVSEHRSLSAAIKSLASDQRGCSDALVYKWSDADESWDRMYEDSTGRYSTMGDEGCE